MHWRPKWKGASFKKRFRCSQAEGGRREAGREEVVGKCGAGKPALLCLGSVVLGLYLLKERSIISVSQGNSTDGGKLSRNKAYKLAGNGFGLVISRRDRISKSGITKLDLGVVLGHPRARPNPERAALPSPAL